MTSTAFDAATHRVGTQDGARPDDLARLDLPVEFAEDVLQVPFSDVSGPGELRAGQAIARSTLVEVRAARADAKTEVIEAILSAACRGE